MILSLSRRFQEGSATTLHTLTSPFKCENGCVLQPNTHRNIFWILLKCASVSSMLALRMKLRTVLVDLDGLSLSLCLILNDCHLVQCKRV